MKPLVLAICLTAAAALVVSAAIPLDVTMSANKITAPGQVIGFNLPNPGHEAAITRIFTMQGQDVGELTAQSLSRFSWDGRDVDQQPVQSGMYVVQISHHGEVWHGPVLVNR